MSEDSLDMNKRKADFDGFVLVMFRRCWWCCLLLAAAAAELGATALGIDLKVGEWNLYYAALDDPYGRRAIVNSIDSSGPFDFFCAVEAQGDTPAGSTEAWSNSSAVLSTLKFLSGSSRYERIALFYDAAQWTASNTVNGSFEAGRPWLLSRFTKTSDGDSFLWVMAVHLPHFLASPGVPGTSDIGAIMVNALTAAGAQPSDPIVFTGDFNEFQWEDNPCMQPIYPKDCRAQAHRRMSTLWDGYLGGSARDVVRDHTLTCCTKWSTKDRFSTNYTEWRFEYDHMFVTQSLDAKSSPQLIPYQYPGTSAACKDAACTGEVPPGNITASHQGSWHRGWSVALTLA